MTGRLIINGRFLAAPQGAVNAVASELTRALIRLSHEDETAPDVRLVVPPTLVEAARLSGLEAIPVGRGGGLGWDQAFLPRLAGLGTICSFFNTVPFWGTGYVTLLHDAHVFTTPGTYRRATAIWRRSLSRRAGRAGNHVLTVSKSALSDLVGLRLARPEAAGVIPLGPGKAAHAEADPSILATLGVPEMPPVFLGLASTLHHKNTSLLLRAFSDPRLADARLVLFGPASAADFAWTGAAVPSNVIFAGYVPDAALAALYDRAVAFLLPSRAEGFGLPVLEAMFRGAPSIVAPCGALPEVGGKAVLTAGPDDPGAWVVAARRLIDEPGLLESLRLAGREQVRGYTWAAAARATLDHIGAWGLLDSPSVDKNAQINHPRAQSEGAG
ncbi:MAG: glycosyltransferase family 1 protein [Pseudomonadota bacterium]